MAGTGYRIAAARGLAVLERVADDLLGGAVPPAWERDAATERELIRDAVRRMHERNARRRPLVSWRS
ncbi:MAG: hypothetical protein ABJA93_11085 [Sporichthyaceae bacterium]